MNYLSCCEYELVLIFFVTNDLVPHAGGRR